METTITYRLDQFEGPLDLLLMLIQKNKVNIIDIPIALICDQYLEYLKAAQDMDMEIAGEFIVMASELMLIKSRLLLPRVEEDEKDPRADLAEALLRYQQAKEAVAKMIPLYFPCFARIRTPCSLTPSRCPTARRTAASTAPVWVTTRQALW